MSQTPGFDQELLEIYGELNRDRLMELVVCYARDRLGAGGSSIFLRDDITGTYVLRGTTGILEGMPTERIAYRLGEGLTGWIAENGAPLRITNPMDEQELQRIAKDLTWSRKYSEISAKSGLAYLGVPILSRDGAIVLGVLRVSGKAEGETFDESDEALLCQVAAMVNIAIENSVRYEREKRQARYFRLLLAISSELDPRHSVDEMLPAVADRVRSGFRTEACLIYLRTEEDIHKLALRAGSGTPESLVGKVTYMIGEGLTGHILANETCIQIRDPAAAEEWDDPHVAEVARHLPSGVYRSYVGVPLQLGNEVLGTLELVNKVPSAPGHRDWFTDDDEGYLRLLSTAIGGVLEGARYLKTLSDVSVTTMRMQRVASFGTLAQRILHETANPLAVARLAATNLRNNMADAPGREGAVRAKHIPKHDQRPRTHDQRPRPASTPSAEGESGVPDHDRSARFLRRLDIIDTSLDEVSSKLLDLLKCSQRIGFVRTTTQWNDIVREVLIWLAAERQKRCVEVHVNYGDLPPLLIEPNELFGVLATILTLTMETLGSNGGLMEIRTSLSPDGRWVRTESRAPEAPAAKRVIAILESSAGETEKLSPLHFEWALAQETTESQYGGTLTWKVEDTGICFLLKLPASES